MTLLSPQLAALACMGQQLQLTWLLQPCRQRVLARVRELLAACGKGHPPRILLTGAAGRLSYNALLLADAYCLRARMDLTKECLAHSCLHDLCGANPLRD